MSPRKNATPHFKPPASPFPIVWQLEAACGDEQARLNRLMRKWKQLSKELADPNVELEAEELAPIFVTFAHLQRAGVKFDPMLVALVNKLRDQAFGTETDQDCDTSSDAERSDAEEDEPDFSSPVPGAIGSELDPDYDNSDGLLDAVDDVLEDSTTCP
jgi:hypothetical protein